VKITTSGDGTTEPAESPTVSSCSPWTTPGGSPARRSWPTAGTHSAFEQNACLSGGPARYVTPTGDEPCLLNWRHAKATG